MNKDRIYQTFIDAESADPNFCLRKKCAFIKMLGPLIVCRPKLDQILLYRHYDALLYPEAQVTGYTFEQTGMFDINLIPKECPEGFWGKYEAYLIWLAGQNLIGR